LLDDLLARARPNGVRSVELEVFAQNERALRLYRSRGFAVLHVLHGYEIRPDADADADADVQAGRSPSHHGPDPSVQPVSLASTFAWLADTAAQIVDLPLQVTPASLSKAPPGLVAWRRGSAQIVFGEPGPGPVVVHSLLDHQPAQADAEALVRALRRHRPGVGIQVPPLQRAELGGDALRRAGLAAQPLHQVLMARPI
jgi:hypothetical protein